VHKEYKIDAENFTTKRKEYTLPSGKRVDFIDFDNKIIYELKPNNSTQIRNGTKQLQGYLDEITDLGKIDPDWAGEWTTVLDTY